MGVSERGQIWEYNNVVKENTIKIGDGAFDSCLIVDENGFIDYKLEEVILPKGLLEIGDYAFQDCPIHKLIIPDSVIRIGKGAFSGAQLESIQLPKGLSTIEEFSFCNCPLLKEVHIPNGVTIIMKYAFEGCDQLKQINLPSSVELVCEDAFPRVESFILNYDSNQIRTWLEIDDDYNLRRFGGISQYATLYVPYGTSEDYRLMFPKNSIIEEDSPLPF